MNKGAELVQYFLCKHTIKNIQWKLNPYNPPLGTPVLWYSDGYGVKEIESSIWPAVSS